MTFHRCIGWWQQSGLGRQPMEDLHIELGPGLLQGQGKDVVGSFSMQGKQRGDNFVEIVKQYQNAHSVLYVGQYDGEGTFFGTWDIGGAYRGKWSIKILKPLQGADQPIRELLPDH